VLGLDAQVLHQEVAIALEARVRGNRQFRRNLERLVNPQMLRLAALGRSGTLARPASGPVSAAAVVTILVAVAITIGLGLHSARLELRLCLLSLEDGNLIAQLLNMLCLLAVLLKQRLDLFQQLLHQRSAL
jgi:hypothetical protein